MDKIIKYLNDNPRYAAVLYVSLAVIAVLIALIFVFRAAVGKKRKKAETAANNGVSLQKNVSEQIEKPKSASGNCSPIKNDDLSAEAAQNKKVANAAVEGNSKTNAENELSEPAGEWKIEEENGAFNAKLVSSGGKVLLKSDDYTSLSGVKSGVETLKNNVDNANYAINVNRSGKFYFKVFSTANRLLCVSDEFSTRNECENAFASARRASKNAKVSGPQK